MDNNHAAMDDKIKLKTEHSLPAKTEPTDVEVTLPLTSDETLSLTNNGNGILLNCEQLSGNSISEFNNINHSNKQQPSKDQIVTSSQYLTAKSTGTDISESNYFTELYYIYRLLPSYQYICLNIN